MLLGLTTDKLSLITEQAGDIDVVVTFIDRNQSTGAIGAADRQLTNITTATTTDILAAPAATTDRKVEAITIRNAHASTSNDVIVQYNANGTLYELHAARLYSTEMLEYSLDEGFSLNTRQTPKFFGSVVLQTGPAIATTNPGQFATLPNGLTLPQSMVGGLTRTFGIFGCLQNSCGVSTTADVVGFKVWDQAVVFGQQSYIGVATNSVTAATLTASSVADVSGVIATLRKGTGTAGTPSVNAIAAGFQYTENSKRAVQLNALLEAENDLGTVTNSASWFQCFEATD